MIKEPEAAALYTLHVLQEKALAVSLFDFKLLTDSKLTETNRKAGDAIVICDAGGGTVDLISYEITSLKPLELKELVPSKGNVLQTYGDVVSNFLYRRNGWISAAQQEIRGSSLRCCWRRRILPTPTNQGVRGSSEVL